VLIVTKQFIPDPATTVDGRLQLVRVVGALVIAICVVGDTLPV
jgi:hypothetical protein